MHWELMTNLPLNNYDDRYNWGVDSLHETTPARSYSLEIRKMSNSQHLDCRPFAELHGPRYERFTNIKSKNSLSRRYTPDYTITVLQLNVEGLSKA